MLIPQLDPRPRTTFRLLIRGVRFQNLVSMSYLALIFPVEIEHVEDGEDYHYTRTIDDSEYL